jgi:hypothetical protein
MTNCTLVAGTLSAGMITGLSSLTDCEIDLYWWRADPNGEYICTLTSPIERERGVV